MNYGDLLFGIAVGFGVGWSILKIGIAAFRQKTRRAPIFHHQV